ncbi:hypothetical protein [Herbidospora daliensis]|uniref:hypothetical protein n=1 Tax=Herbidospora daliensis TaxID=295585 RepID=UPI0007809043|nr:hypothetical protein [Herbidospora daliensis]
MDQSSAAGGDTTATPKSTGPCPSWCARHAHSGMGEQHHFRMIGGWHDDNDVSVELVLEQELGEGEEPVVRVLYGPDWAKTEHVDLTGRAAAGLAEALALMPPGKLPQFAEGLRRAGAALTTG